MLESTFAKKMQLPIGFLLPEEEAIASDPSFSEFYALDDAIEFAAAIKPGVPTKKKCTKGVYCIGKTGKGSCVKAGSKCASKANKGSVDYTSAIGPEPGTSAIAQTGKLTPAQKAAAAKAKNKAAIEAAIAENAKAVPVKESVKASSPDFQPLADMANGLKPDDVKLSAEQTKKAMDWLKKGSDTSTPKIKKMQAEAGISQEEGKALSEWLGHKYGQMSKRIWNPGAIDPQDADAILTADILAAKALHKLAPATKETIIAQTIEKKKSQLTSKKAKESAAAAIAERLDKPLSRWMTVDDPVSFIKKYQDAIGKTITEDNFFGTTHLPDSQMEAFSQGANVAYKVKARLDGTGQGKHVDHFKNTMYEGEILFAPYSKFKVLKVDVPDIKPFEYSAEENNALSIAGKVSACKMLFGSKWKSEYKKDYGEPPSSAEIPKIEEMATKAIQKKMAVELANSGKKYTIYLEEI